MNEHFQATAASLRQYVVSRRDRVTASLNALSNKDGSFASEHRMMIRLYADVLDVIDKHTK